MGITMYADFKDVCDGILLPATYAPPVPVFEKLVLMQQTGLMDSLNAIRALGMEYGRPICMMVGLQGKEPHLKLHESAAYGVRIIKPILDVMQLSNSLIEEPGDIEGIVPAIDRAYQTPAPHCFLIGRSPEAP